MSFISLWLPTVHCPDECRSLVQSPDESHLCSDRGRVCRKMVEYEIKYHPWESQYQTLLPPSLPTLLTQQQARL